MLDMLKVWAPFIVLIVVWIFFMYRLRNGTPQQSMFVAKIDEQTAVHKDIAAALERIATAMELKNK
ncbi:MAG: hypothetical protein CFE33_07105 [Pseudorhodobacter sp. PARRP1]|nr:MAG: hypothetical protein CFE33_07105 [Pseudorhodobacter sp. PARRP1]